jgi:hypothetical protein
LRAIISDFLAEHVKLGVVLSKSSAIGNKSRLFNKADISSSTADIQVEDNSADNRELPADIIAGPQ